MWSLAVTSLPHPLAFLDCAGTSGPSHPSLVSQSNITRMSTSVPSTSPNTKYHSGGFCPLPLPSPESPWIAEHQGLPRQLSPGESESPPPPGLSN
ncbi:hypothetical protein B0O80DRAFT_462685 [Mortierella sp. GBAus27b]|nr:hypothetical protein B0O80DRAFT_462685 [Mortierella sp. GBAus27b]